MGGDIVTHLADASHDNYNSIAELTHTGIYLNGRDVVGTLHVKKDLLYLSIPPSQHIMFSITSQTDKFIEGTYASTMPTDSGTFTLSRVA